METLLEVRDVSLCLLDLGLGLADDVRVAGCTTNSLVALHDLALGLNPGMDVGDLGVGWVLGNGNGSGHGHGHGMWEARVGREWKTRKKQEAGRVFTSQLTAMVVSICSRRRWACWLL